MNKKIISLIAVLAIGSSMMTAYADTDTGEVSTDTATVVEETTDAAESTDVSETDEESSDTEEDTEASTVSGGTVRLTNNGDGTVEVEIESDEGVLEEGVDYTLTYENNTKTGTGTVIITFMGNYTGEIRKDFTIKKTSSSGGSSSSSSGGSSGSSGSSSSSNKTTSTEYSAEIIDSNGNTIAADVETDDDGNVTITLPEGTVLTDDETYTITITDSDGTVQEGVSVTLTDNDGNSATGTTDANGVVVLPNDEEEYTYIHAAYINGYEDGTFKPDGYITRAEAATMLAGALEITGTSSLPFSDVADTAWYADTVGAMYDSGIIEGYEDGTFKPDKTITRAEFVTMLTKNFAEEGETPFFDVDEDSWYADYVYTAYVNGYVDGYEDGAFRPTNPITRAEAVKIINSVLGRTELTESENPFSDVSESHWAYDQIIEAAVEHTVSE